MNRHVGVVTGLCALLAGCVSREVPAEAPAGSSDKTVFTIDLTAASVTNLPRCTPAIAGTTAFVESPPSLYSCVSNAWIQIPCSKVLGGAVAYSSATQTLLACVSGVWTAVASPAGPTGPAGPEGQPGTPGAPGSLVNVTPEPAGANCPAGGQRIDVGADTNGNGVLDASEVQPPRYVCNGVAGTPPTPVCGNGTVEPGEQCDDGNTTTETACPRGQSTCAVCNADCSASLTLFPLSVTKDGTGSGAVTGGPIDCGSTCAAFVVAGSRLTLTATPAAGSAFAAWSGCDSSSGASCIVTVNAHVTVTASFTATATSCAPGATRCVAGNVSAVETCDDSGTGWTAATCPTNQLCTDSACRAPCDLVATPVYPSVCMVPNNDGVNSGTLFLWTDSRLAYPSLSGGGVLESTGLAPIDAAAGQSWPYSWSVSSNGEAAIQFKLSQFTQGRTIVLRYRARRAGAVTGNSNQYTATFFNNGNQVDSGLAGTVPFSFTTSYVSTNISSLSYSGLWNTAMLSITDDGFGGTVDLLDVNWLLLEVR